MTYFKNYLIIVFIISSLNGLAQSQNEIVFVEELKQEGRKQLKRIVSEYEIDDWMFTNTIQMAHGEDAHSHPVLTMNTNHLDDDEVQLSVFLHENAHWFVGDDAKDTAENAAIAELKELFPNPPAPKQKNLYHHIMVVWVEYDAMLELFDAKEANAIMERKIEYYIKGNRKSLLSKNYVWYNDIVMNKVEKVSEIMKKYGFIINPDKGIIID
ncbi:hypothetical protein [Marivirga sp.]|uniref:hypothetical protein n=1 Tax=Marivirga sp. TaxID=2018662 RepID=UPI003DA76E74